jgi:hypothetical protein
VLQFYFVNGAGFLCSVVLETSEVAAAAHMFVFCSIFMALKIRTFLYLVMER